MKLIAKPNRWSCLPAAFAMAMEMDLGRFVAEVGHDGSKVLFPHLPEPACRRGFHIQECIHVALNHGFSATPYEIVPVIAAADRLQEIPVLVDNSVEHRMSVFNKLVATRTGVITGRGRNTNHAVAFHQGTIYDSEGYVYEYSQENCLATGFITQCAWLTS